VKASQFIWTFIWSFNKGLLLVDPPLGRALIEDALLILERFNKAKADKLFQNLSNTIEKRSYDYVNRYVKTDMEIASIIFDKKRKIRWSGNKGNNYISYFQGD